jgi:protein disulfide-isomerase
MKTSLLKFLAAGLLLCFVSPAFADDSHWITNYDKAVEQAKTDGKAILLDFTGSDWCGWCMKMKKESLDTPAFKDYAAKNLILVEVDFPQNKFQSDTLKRQNEQLKTQYKANGFPTFVLVDATGKELGRQVGYLPGGPQVFITKLNTFHAPAAGPATASTGTGAGIGTGADFDKFFKKPAQ